MILKDVKIDSYNAVLGRYDEAELDGMEGQVEINVDRDSARFIPDDPSQLPEGYDDVLFCFADVQDYNHYESRDLQSISGFIEAITE